MLKKEVIQGALMQMGITPNYKGFTYIVEGVLYIDSCSGHYRVSDLYKAIAQKCNTHDTRVERSIRYALHYVRKHTANSELIQKYIGLEHASNGKSLSRFHLILSFEQGGCDAE